MQRKPTRIGSGRFFPEEIEELDQLAGRNTRTRCQQITHLVRLGLAVERTERQAAEPIRGE